MSNLHQINKYIVPTPYIEMQVDDITMIVNEYTVRNLMLETAKKNIEPGCVKFLLNYIDEETEERAFSTIKEDGSLTRSLPENFFNFCDNIALDLLLLRNKI